MRPTTANIWAAATLRSIVVDLLRRKRRRNSRISHPHPAEAAGLEALPDGVPGPAEPCEWQQELQRERERLQQVLTLATETQRRAWELRYRQQLSFAQIASQLRVPVGHVAAWIHRLRLRMRIGRLISGFPDSDLTS